MAATADPCLGQGRTPWHTGRASSQIVAELRSGDLCSEGRDQFADHLSQLIPWADYKRSAAGYGAQVGLPVEGREFVAHVQDYLARVAAETDRGFPTNESLRIEDGEPVLGRLAPRKSASRVRLPPGARGSNLGFRVARVQSGG